MMVQNALRRIVKPHNLCSAAPSLPQLIHTTSSVLLMSLTAAFAIK